LFQLKKDFGERVPDKFPPKKLRSLKQAQLEERREQLEKYLQAISQDPVLVASKTFTKFLLKAQKVSRSLTLCSLLPFKKINLERN
jgi:sorting nexin-17